MMHFQMIHERNLDLSKIKLLLGLHQIYLQHIAEKAKKFPKHPDYIFWYDYAAYQ